MTCQHLLMAGFSGAPARLPARPSVPSCCRQAGGIQTPGLPPHPALLLPSHVPVVLSLTSWPHPYPWPSMANSLELFLSDLFQSQRVQHMREAAMLSGGAASTCFTSFQGFLPPPGTGSPLTVSPFRAEQGTSLETPWRARASSCQEVGTTWFFSSCGHFHFSLSCIGEGNGNPLQCSCLENPRDGPFGPLLFT